MGNPWWIMMDAQFMEGHMGEGPGTGGARQGKEGREGKGRKGRKGRKSVVAGLLCS